MTPDYYVDIALLQAFVCPSAGDIAAYTGDYYVLRVVLLQFRCSGSIMVGALVTVLASSLLIISITGYISPPGS